MNRAIAVRDEAHWHELRQKHIGSSEVSALFGEHRQLTRFELWHIKSGILPAPDLAGNERVLWGQVLEPAVAEGVRRKTGWNIRKVRRYCTCLPDLGLGASLDYEILGHPRGPGVLEIKTADWLVVRDWPDGEPPLSYELQLQHCMIPTGRNWGAMAVLVGGNELRLFEYERRPKTIATIETEIARFWHSIADKTPPSPDFEKDAATISKLYGNAQDGKTVDLTGDDHLVALVTEYQRAAGEEGANKRIRERIRAEVLMRAGDAETVLCGGFRLNLGTVSGTPDRTITEAMIGETIKGRSGFRQLRISERKERIAA